jgi:hypothetical protein
MFPAADCGQAMAPGQFFLSVTSITAHARLYADRQQAVCKRRQAESGLACGDLVFLAWRASNEYDPRSSAVTGSVPSGPLRLTMAPGSGRLSPGPSGQKASGRTPLRWEARWEDVPSTAGLPPRISQACCACSRVRVRPIAGAVSIHQILFTDLQIGAVAHFVIEKNQLGGGAGRHSHVSTAFPGTAMNARRLR